MVASSDGARQLGCVYVDPPDDEGVDAGVWYWARASELASGLEDRIAAFLPGWLADAWSFRVVDINQVPREYLVINEAYTGKMVRASEGKLQIPGIEIYDEPYMRSTGK